MNTSRTLLRGRKVRRLIVGIMLANLAFVFLPGLPSVIAGYSSIAITSAHAASRSMVAQESEDDSYKAGILAEMRELQAAILTLKKQVAANPGDEELNVQFEAAAGQYEELSAKLGGDEPPNEAASTVGPTLELAAVSLASAPPAPPSCSATPATFADNASSSITSLNTTTSTINVSGAGSFLWDVDLQTSITHTANADLDITLTSPSGSTVTVTTDNAGTNDNVFNGTSWDDQASTPVTDFAFANNVVATSLQPEESFGRFIGENPNGTWTLRITDDSLFNTGTLSGWQLNISTLASAPTQATATFTNSATVAIPDNPTVTSTIPVSGAGTSILEVAMVTNITHTFNADLDITLTAPSGRVVTITTDNGGSDNNVFNGTVWDDDAGASNPPGPVSDKNFTNNAAEISLVPEGSMAAFNGEDPNGTWTLTIDDDGAGDTGSLNGWSLIITTASCAAPDLCAGSTQSFNNNTPATISDASPVTQTITVSGAGQYLFDLNLVTAITHNNNADIDMTLTSPAGTVVTITTDNGGSDDNVFNGTLWDDQTDRDGQLPYNSNNGLVTDHNYSNNVVATPLAPEEPLGAFIGENPNGLWTLTIVDDNANSINGSLNNWSLQVTALPGPPAPITTTLSNNTSKVVSLLTPVTSTILVTGAGSYLGRVRVTTDITHTNSPDLDITLTSPSGRIVTLTTDNGDSPTILNRNAFAGTLWDDKAGATNAPGAVTDASYVDNVAETPLAPEEGLASFNGENPNGLWTLTINDDLFDLAVGTLNSWSLEITTITCCSTPEVTTDPVAASVCSGSTATFNAAASGSPAPTVQWQISTDGGATFGNIAGAISTTLSFTATGTQNGNRFRAVFTNTCGTDTSAAATLTVSTASAVTTNPVNQTVCAGSTATFTAAASGNPAPTVQWQVSTDGGSSFSNIGGATSTTLSFSASGGQNGHRFRAVFTNGCGTATTLAAILTVNSAPVITLQPASQTLIGLGSVTFTAAASGTPAPTVQWQVSTDGGLTFNNIPAATSPTLTFTPTPAQNLNRYRAVFTNVCGTATTSTNGSFGLLVFYDISIEQFIESGLRILSFNSATGHYTYRYCRKSYVFQGQGRVVITMTPNNCKIELNDLGPDPKRSDRNISAIVNPCSRAGSASIQVPAAGISHTITDPNTADNANRCP